MENREDEARAMELMTILVDGLQKEELKREKEETKSYERVQRVLDAIAPTSKQKE